ncbi:hypothetical protein N665_0683s0014 [Sinapis alba]|nr:hypothetical protein N665_0683s0014 [Sinapis alba]
MESEASQTPPLDIPEIFFAAEEEPTGVRVTPYHKAYEIRKILNALDSEEVYLVRLSPFGKLKHITGKPYWGELFSTLKEVPVSSVIRRLKKKIVPDKELRLKYAYLALLASIILLTTHTPHISQNYVELIKGLNAFFAYAWGIVSFDMLMSSIKERKEVVMVEVVPSLTKVVQDGSSSGCEEDAHVENMVKLIQQCFFFSSSCFRGGVPKLELSRLREEEKVESLNRKTSKTKPTNSSPVQDGLDEGFVAAIVKDRVQEDFSRIVSQITTHQEAFLRFQSLVLSNMKDFFDKLDENAEKMTSSATLDAEVNGEDAGHPPQQRPSEHQTKALDSEISSDSTLDPALLFPKSTFSLGLTQEVHPAVKENVNDTVNAEAEVADEKTIQAYVVEAVIGYRKSKRHKVPSKSLLGHYECDIRFLNRARQAAADSNNPGGSIDYSAKFSLLLDKIKTKFEVYEIVTRSNPLSSKVVDVLMFHISSLFLSLSPANQQTYSVFLDSRFLQIPSSVTEVILQNESLAEVKRFYFPVNIDKKYWVGICRTDYMMNKEIPPVAQMFPYLLNQVGKQVVGREAKPMALGRPRTISQHNVITDSAVSSILFVQAHVVVGVEVYKCITPDVLDTEVDRIVVTL